MEPLPFVEVVLKSPASDPGKTGPYCFMTSKASSLADSSVVCGLLRMTAEPWEKTANPLMPANPSKSFFHMSM